MLAENLENWAKKECQEGHQEGRQEEARRILQIVAFDLELG